MAAKAGDAAQVWELASGRWRACGADNAYVVVANPAGVPVSPELSSRDAGALAGAKYIEGRGFPPEFTVDPHRGQRLPAGTPDAAVWIPPFGARVGDGGHGLQATDRVLRVARAGGRSETADPDRQMPLPPNGRYEFISLPLPAAASALLALDAERGQVFLWAVHARRWLPIKPAAASMELAPTSLPRRDWRCAAGYDERGGLSILYLPTEEGLAALRFDLLTLTYHVDYPLLGKCHGAPLLWRDKVWVMLQSEGAEDLCIQSLSPRSGAIDAPMPIEAARKLDRGPVEFASPASVARHLIWPGSTGCVSLEFRPKGTTEAAYRPWPAGFEPAFELGAPYLCNAGQLWQTGWSNERQSYVCLRLDGRDFETRTLTVPRMCAGQVNYRLSTRMAQALWQDPEQGSDSEARAIFVPMLESDTDRSVVGTRVFWTGPLKSLLASNEKYRSVLELHGGSAAETRLHALNITAPWLGRVFFYDRALWYYHPELSKLCGWDSEP